MTFSDFAQMMYPIIGNGENKSKFIIKLTKMIMKRPKTKGDIKKSYDDSYYPLNNLSINTLEKIFNGKRNLSQKAAIVINSHLDKNRFSNYLRKFSDDVKDLIGSALKKNEIEIVNGDIIETCTEFYVKIIQDCAYHNRKSRKLTKLQSDNMDIIAKKFPEWYAQLHRESLKFNNLLHIKEARNPATILADNEHS